MSGAVDRAAGAKTGTARLVERDTGMQKCAYTAGTTRVEVSDDGLPQAYRRWADSEVERSQNTSAWHIAPAEQPQPVDGVGLGAYWVAAERTLYAADARRLLMVSVSTPAAGDAQAIARAAAQAALHSPLPRE